MPCSAVFLLSGVIIARCKRVRREAEGQRVQESHAGVGLEKGKGAG